MAGKKPVNPRGQPTDSAPDDSLSVLFPDRQLTVGGVEVTVRELSFSEQLRHNHLLAPLGDSLAAIPPQKMDSPESINVIFDALALHADALRELIAISCGQSMDWVDALPPDEGEALVLTWWEVNNGFFVRRLWRPRLLEMAQPRSALEPSLRRPHSRRPPPRRPQQLHPATADSLWEEAAASAASRPETLTR
ncbi:DUF6631 family protein [Pseudomonas aeruginosa]|uniref:DUF6631 family protein n=1 Tax=Pseudomonas aeruginosa TaxID=287 RepID=UPI001F5BED0F|nr:DUF6631 family protein [Pseudomonas aeruginosa]UIO45633.1 hypothetical protein K5A80_15805 [Pseudomonas aeruginosa]